MLNPFALINIALIIVLGVLIYKNRAWENQPVVIICFLLTIIALVMVIIFV